MDYAAGSVYPMKATKDSPNPAATLYAVWEEITYTVTYTDGVDGEVIFDDVVYPNLTAGTQTPAFNTDGTNPTRGGYTFAGWQPAVAETVTGNALYTAQWTKNAPAKPEGDELPDISVTVDCTNTSVTHPDKTYGLLNGCYTVT